jgi:hypothetical protein
MGFAAMKRMKVILTIDSDLLREARTLASEKGISVSELISGQLKKAIGHRRLYRQARGRALARLRTGFDLQWKPTTPRDELHRP